MDVLVPYTVIKQHSVTGSVSSEVIDAPQDTQRAKTYINRLLPPPDHVVAFIKGTHPVIIGAPGPV